MKRIVFIKEILGKMVGVHNTFDMFSAINNYNYKLSSKMT